MKSSKLFKNSHFSLYRKFKAILIPLSENDKYLFLPRLNLQTQRNIKILYFLILFSIVSQNLSQILIGTINCISII